jgi:hypothetical protein
MISSPKSYFIVAQAFQQKKKNIIELFTITQQEDKNIMVYFQRFNKKMLNVEKLFEPIVIETLINGVYNCFLMRCVIHSPW